MQIDLSKNEIETIDTALDLLASKNSSTAFTTSLLAVMLSPKDKPEETFREESEKRHAEAAAKDAQAKYKVTLLKAKLYQALNRDCEHSVD